MAVEVLFEPVTLGKRKLKNRLAFAPVGMCTADDEGRPKLPRCRSAFEGTHAWCGA